MGHEIEQWQHSLRDHAREPSSSRQDGLAARLTTTAADLFRLVLHHAERQVSRSVFRTLEREYGYLQLWCDGYGVPSGDVDVILAESRRLRHSTYRLLVNICHILADKVATMLLPALDDDSQSRMKASAARTRDLIETTLFAIQNAEGNDSDSDSGSDVSSAFGDYSIEDIAEDLKTDIQCLVDLGPRFKEPIRDRAVKEDAAQPAPAIIWDPAEYLTSRIRHRYPNGDADFARVLGKTNWQTAQRLYALKEANTGQGQVQAATLEVSCKPVGTAVASDFQDSGLGTSVATPSSYAETILSYRSTRGGSVKIPQVPGDGQIGKPFTCDICGRMCQLPAANRKRYWKRHVLSDLEPYVCVIAKCSFSGTPFPQKKAWVHHLELEHGFSDRSKDITCPLCQESVGVGKAAHLARHLEEVSLTILPANAESDDEPDMESDEEPNHMKSGNQSEGTVHPSVHNDSTSQDRESHLDASPRPETTLDLPAPRAESDSGRLFIPLPLLGRSSPEAPDWIEAVALADFETDKSDELPLTKGDTLWISQEPVKNTSPDWVLAISHSTQRKGFVPRSCIDPTGLPTQTRDMMAGGSERDPTWEGLIDKSGEPDTMAELDFSDAVLFPEFHQRQDLETRTPNTSKAPGVVPETWSSCATDADDPVDDESREDAAHRPKTSGKQVPLDNDLLLSFDTGGYGNTIPPWEERATEADVAEAAGTTTEPAPEPDWKMNDKRKLRVENILKRIASVRSNLALGAAKMGALSSAQFPCPAPDCDRIFETDKELQTHNARFHDEGHWKCQEEDCNKRFFWRREMSRHYADEHMEPSTLFKCPVQPCPYESIRMADIEHHLEQAHLRIHYEDDVAAAPPTPSKRRSRAETASVWDDEQVFDGASGVAGEDVSDVHGRGNSEGGKQGLAQDTSFARLFTTKDIAFSSKERRANGDDEQHQSVDDTTAIRAIRGARAGGGPATGDDEDDEPHEDGNNPILSARARRSGVP